MSDIVGFAKVVKDKKAIKIKVVLRALTNGKVEGYRDDVGIDYAVMYLDLGEVNEMLEGKKEFISVKTGGD